MTDPAATPEVQATADLSPLSPSPLHSVAPVVLPALQDTADLLDTMTEMPSAQEQAAVLADTSQIPAPHQSEPLPATVGVTGPAEDPNDDVDSLDDDYKEEEPDVLNKNIPAQSHESAAGDDDYLKSFDSPAQDGEEASSAQDDAPRAQDPGEPNDALAHQSSSEAAVAPVARNPPTAPSQAAQAPLQPSNQATAPQPADHSVDAAVHEAEISRLVAEMAAQANDEQAVPNAASTPSSLPPRPPQSEQAPVPGQLRETYPQQLPVAPAYVLPGGPAGASVQVDHSGQPLPPATATANYSAPSYPANPGYQPDAPNDQSEYERLWQLFQEDERRYMAEANWDRFPEGTRIFIGNLSSERVSKRDVFNMFYHYGRLAQISLKSAYGFVQYHEIHEAQAAMQALQGAEVKGRKIHLEISKAQKKKGGNDRGRSPDRNRGGRESGQKGGRFDGGQPNRRSRDDFRSGRADSQQHGREDSHGRDRGYYENQQRGRSRSPTRFGRQPDQQYRRRSPSPANAYGRGPGPVTEDRLEIPRRYGSQVPDVQILLVHDVGREFVEWVERAFTARGLKVDAMFMSPSLPRDAVVQRQVVEGVHGIVDLDMRAHTYGKIPLRVFNRSGGTSARFDDYQDLDPPIAAELIARAKSQSAPVQHHTHAPPQQAYGGGGFAPSYPPQPHAAPPPGPAYPPAGPAPPVSQQPEIERLLSQFGNLDPATLQQLVATVQASSGPGQAPPYGGGPSHQQAGPPLDVNAILASLTGGAHSAAPPVPSYAPPPQQGYPPAGPSGSNGHYAPPHAGAPMGAPPSDSASQVNTIMAQLAKFRQP